MLLRKKIEIMNIAKKVSKDDVESKFGDELITNLTQMTEIYKEDCSKAITSVFETLKIT